MTLFHNENENDLGQRWRDLLEEFKGREMIEMSQDDDFNGF